MNFSFFSNLLVVAYQWMTDDATMWMIRTRKRWAGLDGLNCVYLASGSTVDG